VFTNKAPFWNINKTAFLKFLMRYTFNLYNARLSHLLSTRKEQFQGLDGQAECARDLPPDKNTPVLEQNGDFIIPLADDVLLGQTCEQGVEDVATSEGFCTISSLFPRLLHRAPLSTRILLRLEVPSRLPWRMRLHMIIKLLARKFTLANFVLILVRRDAVLVDAIAMAVFNGFGDIRGVGGFVTVPWLGGFRRFRGC
jgi:hypothetical protein